MAIYDEAFSLGVNLGLSETATFESAPAGLTFPVSLGLSEIPTVDTDIEVAIAPDLAADSQLEALGEIQLPLTPGLTMQAIVATDINLPVVPGVNLSSKLAVDGALDLPVTLGVALEGTVQHPDTFPLWIRGLGFTVLKRPEFSTLIQSSPNRYETRIPQSDNPIWHWSVVYNYLKDYDIQPGLTYTDLRTLMGFFLSHQGAGLDFLLNDPDDNYVGPALVEGEPNPLAELQLVSDGTGKWYSPIRRDLGGFSEDITDLNGEIQVYANGVLQTRDLDYTIEGPGLAVPGKSFSGLYLAWSAQPPSPITAEFNFYFRVRFESDEQDFEKFMDQLWTVGAHSQRGSGEIRLISARPPQAPPLEPPCPEPVSWVPVPAPLPGHCRTIVPATCSGTSYNSCYGIAACSGSSASLEMWHEAPLGTGPRADFIFTLPSYLFGKTITAVYGVMVFDYSTGPKVAVGSYNMAIGGSPIVRFGGGSEVVVTNFGTDLPSTAYAYIAGTLENPIGACYPCGEGGGCEMMLNAAFSLVINYVC